MKSVDRQRYQARARIAKALAHPSRLLMLDALQERDCCVGELAELVGADQSTISKHLAILKNNGLVDDRREGSNVYYQLKCKCLGGFFTCLETILKENLREQQRCVK